MFLPWILISIMEELWKKLYKDFSRNSSALDSTFIYMFLFPCGQMTSLSPVSSFVQIVHFSQSKGIFLSWTETLNVC